MTTNAAVTYQVGTIVHAVPDTLLMERNIREAQPDADLIRSVRDLGVLEPITAVLIDHGWLLVRQGHAEPAGVLGPEPHAGRDRGRP